MVERVSMRAFAGFCLFALSVLAGGCADAAGNRPSVYRGGQYYGDAVHAGDFKGR